MPTRLKPPTKYVKTVNPEYTEYLRSRERKQALTDAIYTGAQIVYPNRDNPFAAGESARAELMALFPEDYNATIPDSGHWVMVTRPPCTEVQVGRFSIWFALPETRPSGRAGYENHLARILTPVGDLWLWPHEYVKVDVSKYLEFIGKGFELEFFSESAAVNTEPLFYLMSRGLPRPTALKLLLLTLNSQTICWLEASEEVRAVSA